MTQEHRSPQSASPVPAHVDSMEEQGNDSQDASVFPVVRTTVLHPVTMASTQRVGHLPPGVARLVSLVGLGAALLMPLSGCSDPGSASLPCPVPTADAEATQVADGTPTANCTTSNGTHYLWIQSRGGWVQSDDGTHPNSDAHGVGVDDGHASSGVGDGRGGAGHGGGDGD